MQTAMRTPAQFDPNVDGIPDHVWSDALHGAPRWSPRPGPLFVLSPHPDDEVLGAGGLMAMRAGLHPVTVISVTDGEQAFPGWHELAAVRRAELTAALRALTPHCIEVIRLGYPDAAVSGRADQLRDALRTLLRDARTLVIPFEQDGHPDHDVCGAIGREVGVALGIEVVRYPIWRWHHGDHEIMTRLQWGRFPLDVETRTAKSAAMRCFRSQLAPPGSPILPAHVLTYFERSFEAFVL